MLSLIIKLTFAHILGDFVLQPDSWAQDKSENKIRSIYLYLHPLVHAILVLALLNFDSEYYIAAPIITLISHFAIDTLKVYLENDNNNRWLFFADQLLHIIVIALIVDIYTPYNIEASLILSDKLLLLFTALFAVTYSVSVIMKVLISKFDIDSIAESNSSLPKAGKYIGILERLFIFGFVILNQWAGIGFLLAAKSIFRFGDLSKAKDRKLTEYILIGTLLSFGIAILIALVYLKILKTLN
ncbi:MAG: DUF3307 domain-containing protein [Bacteroidota bacterium]